MDYKKKGNRSTNPCAKQGEHGAFIDLANAPPAEWKAHFQTDPDSRMFKMLAQNNKEKDKSSRYTALDVLKTDLLTGDNKIENDGIPGNYSQFVRENAFDSAENFGRNVSCKFCGHCYDVRELEQHSKHCAGGYDDKNVVLHKKLPNTQRFQQKNHPCFEDMKMNRRERESQEMQMPYDSASSSSPISDNFYEDHTKEAKLCEFCHRYFRVDKFQEHVACCFLAPIECKLCYRTFTVDKYPHHLCALGFEKYKIKSDESQKLQHSDDRVLTSLMEDEKPSSGFRKSQQNEQLTQNPSQFMVPRQCSDDYVEHSKHELSSCVHKGNTYSFVKNQISSSVDVQKPNSALEKQDVKNCKFSSLQSDAADAEEFRKHVMECDEPYTCSVCRKHLKFEDLENHKISSSKKVKLCSSCKRSYPLNEIREHTKSCNRLIMTCELCKKGFLKGQFAHHACFNGGRTKNRIQSENDQPNEDDEQSVEACSISAENVRTPVPSGRPKAEVSDSVVDESLEGNLKNMKLDKGYFMCKICDKKKCLDDLSRFMFSDYGALVCMNCVTNLKQLTPEFLKDLYSSGNSASKNANDSQRTEGVREEQKTEVRACELCFLHVPLNGWDEHTKTCKNVPYECPRCDNLVLRCDKKAHDSMCGSIQPNQLSFACQEVDVSCGMVLDVPKKEEKASFWSKKNFWDRLKSKVSPAENENLDDQRHGGDSYPSPQSGDYRFVNPLDRDHYNSNSQQYVKSNEHLHKLAEEPAVIPCEFCGQMFSEENIIQHQSGCKPELFVNPPDRGYERERFPRNTGLESDNVASINVRERRDRNHDMNFLRIARQVNRHTAESKTGNKMDINSYYPTDSNRALGDVRMSHHKLGHGGLGTSTTGNMIRAVWNVNEPDPTEKVDIKKHISRCKENQYPNKPQVQFNSSSKYGNTSPESGIPSHDRGIFDDDDEIYEVVDDDKIYATVADDENIYEAIENSDDETVSGNQNVVFKYQNQMAYQIQKRSNHNLFPPQEGTWTTEENPASLETRSFSIKSEINRSKQSSDYYDQSSFSNHGNENCGRRKKEEMKNDGSGRADEHRPQQNVTGKQISSRNIRH